MSAFYGSPYGGYGQPSGYGYGGSPSYYPQGGYGGYGGGYPSCPQPPQQPPYYQDYYSSQPFNNYYSPQRFNYNDMRAYDYGPKFASSDFNYKSNNGYHNYTINLFKDNFFGIFEQMLKEKKEEPEKKCGSSCGGGGGGQTVSFAERVKKGDKFEVQFTGQDDGRYTGSGDALGIIDARKKYIVNYNADGTYTGRGYFENIQADSSRTHKLANPDNNQFNIGDQMFTVANVNGRLIVKQGDKEVGTFRFLD